MLLFKKKFIDQIRDGVKTQTVRLWKRRMVKPGQRSYIQGIGYILITSVEPVELDELTDADAILDGFPNADALRAELCALYNADVLAKRKPYIIRFSVYPQAEQDRLAAERKQFREAKNKTRKLF